MNEITTKRQDLILSVVLWLIVILACLGAVSPVLWYRAERASVSMRLTTAEQARVIQGLTDKNADLRYKIEQANRLLAVAYPYATMDFITED